MKKIFGMMLLCATTVCLTSCFGGSYLKVVLKDAYFL